MICVAIRSMCSGTSYSGVNRINSAPASATAWAAATHSDTVPAIEEAAVAGTVSECVAAAQEVADAGAELILFTPLYDVPEHMERIATQIIPRLG